MKYIILYRLAGSLYAIRNNDFTLKEFDSLEIAQEHIKEHKSDDEKMFTLEVEL